MKKIFQIILGVFAVCFCMGNLKVYAAGWGYSRNSDHLTPSIGQKYEKILEGTSSYYIGDPSKSELFLTFDAGYDNDTLSGILDTLKAQQIQASFFLTGDFVKRFPELCLRISQEGHTACNHSYSHYDMTTLSKEQLASELTKVEVAYQTLTKTEMSKYFRPPAGSFDRKHLEYLDELGYKTVFWSLAYCDWKVDDQMPAAKTHETVMNNLHNGAIILMHSVSKSNAEALNDIINDAKALGYQFLTVEKLQKGS